MKKSLLLVSALSVCLFAGAQTRELSKTYKAQVRPVDMGISNPEINANQTGGDDFGGIVNRSGDIFKTQISTSGNVFGIFSVDQTVLTTQPELNTVTFGTRAGGAMGATGNDLRIAYSSDLGTTWTNFVVQPAANKNFRYPSVATYNPQGNTDPANMYAIFSGPYTNASGWEGQYWGSVKFDGTTDKNVTYEPNASNIYLNHMNIGLCVTPSGKVHVASQKLTGTEASYQSQGFEILNGTFNETTKVVDWELPRVTVNPLLGDDNRIDAATLAFSPDGSVGYLVCSGIDTDENYNPYGVEWPVVYKTTDDGQTWEKTEPFDFSTIGVFNEMLYPTRANLDFVCPRYTNKWKTGNRGNGATVDNQGNLHISGIMVGTYSINPDSLTYFYTEEPTLVFDLFMKGDGTWDAMFVDSIRTEVVDETDPFGMGWDQRIYMTRSDDGAKVFTTWTDTDPILWGGGMTTNLQPDIFIWGHNLITEQVAGPVNVTAYGDYWGDNRWSHVSNMVLESDEFYTIPMSTSASSTSGGNQDQPMSHYYVGGVGYTYQEVAVNDVKAISNASVSQNYPNPSNGTTQFVVSLDKAASVSVDVYNLVGQRVNGISAQKYSAGDNTITLNTTTLKAGVYMYTVTVNGERYSRKMTVK